MHEFCLLCMAVCVHASYGEFIKNGKWHIPRMHLIELQYRLPTLPKFVKKNISRFLNHYISLFLLKRGILSHCQLRPLRYSNAKKLLHATHRHTLLSVCVKYFCYSKFLCSVRHCLIFSFLPTPLTSYALPEFSIHHGDQSAPTLPHSSWLRQKLKTSTYQQQLY